jgi:hypothetical protein
VINTTKIKAVGERHGSELEIEAFQEDGSIIIEVNGDHDEYHQDIFNALMDEAPALGGTYYPPAGSMLCALSVLRYTFFDETPDIEVEGDIGTIPHEDGVIY